MEPLPPSDEPPGWPLHQRLLGVLVRTAAVLVALLPAALVVLLDADAEGAGWFLLLSGVLALSLLAPERRDGGVGWTLGRLQLGGVLATALLPIAFVSVRNLGSPEGGLADMQRLLDQPLTILAVLLGAVLAAPALGALLVVRACTARLLPQVAACLMTVFLPAVTPILAETNRWREWRAVGVALLSAVLVPAALVLSERWTARLDPSAPRPPERETRPILAVYAVVLALVGALPALSVRSVRWRHDGAWRAQQVVYEAQRLHSNVTARGVVPRNLWELGVAPSFRSGLQGETLFRVVGSRDGTRWAIGVDHAQPGRWRSHAVVDGAGVVSTHDGPVAIDPETCAPRPRRAP